MEIEEQRLKHKLYMKEYNLRNKEKMSQQKKDKRKTWTDEEIEADKLRRKIYHYKRIGNTEEYEKLKQRRKEVQKKYRETNKDKLSVSNYISYRELRDIVVSHYGGKCICCGETMKSFLQIDHINNDGNICRKVNGRGTRFYKWIIRNNFPDTLQILCANCNISKRINNGVCEHMIFRDQSKDNQVLYSTKKQKCSDEECYL
jgi:hypothetical protein